MGLGRTLRHQGYGTSRSLVVQTIIRDGTCCIWCGWDLVASRRLDNPPTPDHVIPRKRRGPKLSLWNVVLSCRWCNEMRGSIPAWLWAQICLMEGRNVQLDLVAAALDRVRERAGSIHPMDVGWIFDPTPGEVFHA